MRINESSVRRIIREEAHRVMLEGGGEPEHAYGEERPSYSFRPREELGDFLRSIDAGPLVPIVDKAIDLALGEQDMPGAKNFLRGIFTDRIADLIEDVVEEEFGKD